MNLKEVPKVEEILKNFFEVFAHEIVSLDHVIDNLIEPKMYVEDPDDACDPNIMH